MTIAAGDTVNFHCSWVNSSNFTIYSDEPAQINFVKVTPAGTLPTTDSCGCGPPTPSVGRTEAASTMAR